MTAAHDALDVALTLGSPTKIAFERFYYGRALLLNGQVEEALAQFNPPDLCTPLIALCKEPSEENRALICEILAAGADAERRDESGYSALDWAFYTRDTATQDILDEHLRLKLGGQDVEALRDESLLRRSYRELVQNWLRPVLVQAGNHLGLHHLRKVMRACWLRMRKTQILSTATAGSLHRFCAARKDSQVDRRTDTGFPNRS